MLKHNTAAILSAVALLASASAASADTVTYNFLSNTPITLPNTPLTSINAEPGGTVVQTATDGLGVNSHFGTGLFSIVDPDPNLINVNSAGVPEFIQFNFNPSVTVSSISFTAFTDDTTGKFFGIPFTNINSGDNPVVSYSTDGVFFSGPFVTQITSGNTFTFSEIPSGTQIESLIISAPSVLAGLDSFGIGSLTVDYTPVTGGSGAPLPDIAHPSPPPLHSASLLSPPSASSPASGRSSPPNPCKHFPKNSNPKGRKPSGLFHAPSPPRGVSVDDASTVFANILERLVAAPVSRPASTSTGGALCRNPFVYDKHGNEEGNAGKEGVDCESLQ